LQKKRAELFERIFNTADVVVALSLLTFPKDRRFFAESSSQILFRFLQTRPKLSFFFFFVFVSLSLLSSRRLRDGHQQHKTTALILGDDDDFCERNRVKEKSPGFLKP